MRTQGSEQGLVAPEDLTSRTGKGTGHQALLTFQDVVACFSDEEWELLDKWQKDLYANVMKEIHQVFLSLGPVIANSVFSLRAKEKEGVCPLDDEDFDRRDSEGLSQSATVSKLDACTTSREVVPCLKDPLQTDGMGRPKRLCTERSENPDLLSTGRIESLDRLDTDRRRSHDLLGSDKKESPFPLEQVRRKTLDMLNTSQTDWCKEPELTIVMVSDGIKEEQEVYPLAEQNPGNVKNIHSPTEQELTIVMVSDSIKEEVELYPLAEQNPENVKNIHSPAEHDLTIVMVSDSIKEEEALYPLAEQNPRNVEQSKESSTSKKGPHASAEYKEVSPLKSTTELHQTLQTDKTLFNCAECQQSFPEKESLQLHMGIHRVICRKRSPYAPRKPHPRSSRFRGGPQRGGEGGALSSAHAVRVLGAPVAAQLTGELRTGRSRDPETGGAPGALGGSPVRVVSCVRHRSASALRRWLRRAGFALLTWDPETETPLALASG
ncbi:hypothetical protein NDU88_000516 [Pleurodeles waltl]|uniref:Uncharacterized protein n=1 Tax=Pleurodeles waltl TaxID=8319 RepID=A0AAV7NCY3_PLEWA|nr:hypothetical protein NDU88_000516 [Pleurodeles waltl]